MVDIVVRRGAGTVFGADVIDPLISTVSAALERGRIELDANATQGAQETLRTVHRAGISKGMVVEVQDGLQGVNWRGVIMAIRRTAMGAERVDILTLVRVT